MRDLLAQMQQVVEECAVLQQAAEKSRAGAETANRTKDEFLALASHECVHRLTPFLAGRPRWAATPFRQSKCGGGRIRVQLHRQDACVQLQAIDSGEGIEPELLARVFERFWQADSSNTRTRGGRSFVDSLWCGARVCRSAEVGRRG